MPQLIIHFPDKQFCGAHSGRPTYSTVLLKCGGRTNEQGDRDPLQLQLHKAVSQPGGDVDLLLWTFANPLETTVNRVPDGFCKQNKNVVPFQG